MLRDSTVVVVAVAVAGAVAVAVLGSRPRVRPLEMITMRTSIHGFPLIPYMVMGLRWGPFGPPELRYEIAFFVSALLSFAFN